MTYEVKAADACDAIGTNVGLHDEVLTFLVLLRILYSKFLQ